MIFTAPKQTSLLPAIPRDLMRLSLCYLKRLGRFYNGGEDNVRAGSQTRSHTDAVFSLQRSLYQKPKATSVK